MKACKHCERAFSSSCECCCSGCALASRLPLGETQLPATWQLGVALAWFFALFNQLLFAGVALFSFAREQLDRAERFEALALGVGVLVLLWSSFLFAVVKPKRWTDFAVMSGACATVAFGLFRLEQANAPLCGANLVLAAWLSRGLWWRKASKKRQND